MQINNRFLDDMARVAAGAAGALAGVKEELEVLMRQRFEKWLGDMQLVTREEFEAVKAMAAKAREEQEALAARVAALEAKAKPAPRGGAKARGAKPKHGESGPA